ncbi:hypothetical protein PsYK624_091610 [Phanerochaete sordida]|uniref:Uncharacterized protein n=1 Tax=Phanerochaete sordida TaxID=48140 RepID=A0A9P3GDZ7_9APHY|nr:hypothetical protein PsYK624_091610 [Phanerochaete sordida]
MSKFLKKEQFDVDAFCASWTDAPVPKWHGIPDRDGSVADWLAKLEGGLKERKVPKDYWHDVAFKYMGDRATRAWVFVGAATAHMFGSKFKWNWKRYKKVMILVPWGTLVNDPWYKRLTWQIKQQLQPPPSPPPPPPPPVKQPFLRRSRTVKDDVKKPSERPEPQRTASLFTFGSSSNAESSKTATVKKKADPPKEKEKEKSMSAFLVKASKDEFDGLNIPPEWLVIVLEALKGLSSEYPVAMSAASAVLIAMGTIPSLPVVSAGAAGVFLASGTAQTLGSLAVGLGTLLSAQQAGLIDK